MSGYKDFVFTRNAAAFWSFDGDAVTNELQLIGGNIMDEIDNQNPAALVSSPGGYVFASSLVGTEPADNRSLLMCPWGKVNGTWISTYLEIPQSSSFYFPHYGSFTVEFLLKKQNETAYYQDTGTWSFKRTLLKKAGVFEIYIQYSWSLPPYLYFKGPNGFSKYITFNSFHGRTLEDIVLHLVLVWDARPDPSGTYDYMHTCSAYVNSTLVGSASYGTYDGVINTNIASSIFVGGCADETSTFQTSKTYFDQIAIYDVALSDDDVCHHYKKIFPYESMLMNQFPKYYWKMYDNTSYTDYTMYESYSTAPGTYGSYVQRQQDGPPQIVNSSSVYFPGNTMARVTKADYYYGDTALFTVTADYSVEFWFLINSSKRGIIFSCQQDEYPFTGVAIIANKQKTEDRHGFITFSERVGANLSSLEKIDGVTVNYADNNWHHLVALRTGDKMQLWLDGLLHEELQCSVSSAQTNPSQIYIMGMMPFDQFVAGNISNLAVYPYALSKGQIISRANYEKVYKIQGQITLRGVPVRATIRVYKTKSGSLVKEIYSDENTGNYTLELRTNAKIDILVSIPEDNTVRYRAFGPIMPAEFPDVSLNL